MVYLDTMPLRLGHFRVLITTAMGQFLGAAVATLSGVLIPLLAIVQHHELDSVTQGYVSYSLFFRLLHRRHSPNAPVLV